MIKYFIYVMIVVYHILIGRKSEKNNKTVIGTDHDFYTKCMWKGC